MTDAIIHTTRLDTDAHLAALVALAERGTVLVCHQEAPCAVVLSAARYRELLGLAVAPHDAGSVEAELEPKVSAQRLPAYGRRGGDPAANRLK